MIRVAYGEGEPVMLLVLPHGTELSPGVVESIIKQLRSYAETAPSPLSPALPSPHSPLPTHPHSPTPTSMGARRPAPPSAHEGNLAIQLASPHGDDADEYQDPTTERFSTNLTVLREAVRVPTRPLWAFQGQDPKPNSKGETLAPRKCLTAQEEYEWAVDRGWRSDQRAFMSEIEACLAWFAQRGRRHKDWEATVQGWILRTIKRGNDIPYNGQSMALTTPDAQGDNDGLRRTGYGYDRSGNPTNRATAFKHTVEQVDAVYRRRRMERDAGEDAAPLGGHDGGGD